MGRSPFRKNALTRLAFGSVFASIFLFSGPHASSAKTESLAGFQIQDPNLDRYQGWLNALTPLLKEHAQATGQILRIEVTQAGRSEKNTALNALVSLPILNSERKNTCVVLQEVASVDGQTLKTGNAELECGLGLNGVLESKKIQLAVRSLSHSNLRIREWEARHAWLILELLEFLESPVGGVAPELQSGQETMGLHRFAMRWKDFQSALKTHDIDAPFDPDAVLDEEGLYPGGERGSLSGRTVRRIPDAAAFVLLSCFLSGLVWAANIARRPAYRCTSSGLFRLKLSDRLMDRGRETLSRISKKPASRIESEHYVLKG